MMQLKIGGNSEMKYQVKFFNNGKIAFLDEQDFRDAILAGKEILLVMKGAGAYHIGADKICDEYSCYTTPVGEEVLTETALTKIHKVIFTDGVDIYMKSGRKATSFMNGFRDDVTTLDEYNEWHNTNVDEIEFGNLCRTIDHERTFYNIKEYEIDGAEKVKCMKGYSCFSFN